jgi:microcystin-dependent protein
VYASLFGIIGTTYGSGDGTSTFNLPNTQGLFLRGAGSQTVSSRVYIATLGAYTVDSTAVNGLHDTGHAHQQSFGALPGESDGIIGSSTYSAFPANINTQLDRAALIGDYETKPANLAVNYIIKY